MATWRDTTSTGRSGATFESGFYQATSVFSVASYGGTGSGSSTKTADNAAIVLARAAAVAAGGGVVFFPEGDWHFTAAYDPGDNITWAGAGLGVTILRQTVDATRLFTYNSTARNFCAFRDFTAYGMWETTSSLGTDDDRHFAVNNYTRVIYDNVESRYCRQMGITSNGCDEVVVRNCVVKYCARDAINLATSNRCVVVGNHIIGAYDDAIAVHTNTTAGNPPTSGHIVADNIIEDAFGIKVLGATRVAITGNTISRPKAYGIYLAPTATTEGRNDHTDVTITGNVITDVINPIVFGGTSMSHGIYIANDDKSFARPVVPTTPTITKPEDLSYVSNTTTAQSAGAQRIVVSGNIVARTLPQAANYSDWGYGEAFTASGWDDPAMTTWTMTYGISLLYALLSVAVQGNHVELVDRCVNSSDITHIESLRIVDNTFRRFDRGVSLDDGAHMLYGRCEVVGNLFDGDPLFESADRVAGGKWGNVTSPCAVWANNFDGWDIRGNTFRNLARSVHQTTTPYAGMGANTYYMQPASAMTLASPSHADNAGIRTPYYCETPGSRIVWEVSDPTHADYGKILSNQETHAQASIPTTDYWVTGQTVLSTGITESGSASSMYTILGWRRLTTGNAHVLDTDWRELRGLTGN